MNREKKTAACSKEIEESDKSSIDALISRLSKKAQNNEKIYVYEISDLIRLYKELKSIYTKDVLKSKIKKIILYYNVLVENDGQDTIKSDENIPVFSVGEIVTEFLRKIIDPIRRSKVYKNHKKEIIKSDIELSEKYSEIYHCLDDGDLDKASEIASTMKDKHLSAEIFRLKAKTESFCNVRDYVFKREYTYSQRSDIAQELINNQCMVNGPILFFDINTLRKMNLKKNEIGSLKYKKVIGRISSTIKRALPKIEEDETVFEDEVQTKIILSQYLDIIATSNDIENDVDLFSTTLNSLKIDAAIKLAYLNKASSIALYRTANDLESYEENHDDIDDAIRYYDSFEYKETGLPYIKS